MFDEMNRGLKEVENTRKEFIANHTQRINELNAALEALHSCEDTSESDPAIKKINQDLDDLLASL